MNNSIKYKEYLQSDEWKQRRENVLIFWDHRCAICYSNKNVQVHHRTYDRVGHELLNDLLPLCEECHKRHHGIVDDIANISYSGRVMLGKA